MGESTSMFTTSEAPGAFIARLRRIRRSSWLLIAACTIARIGDAAINDMPVPNAAATSQQEGNS